MAFSYERGTPVQVMDPGLIGGLLLPILGKLTKVNLPAYQSQLASSPKLTCLTQLTLGRVECTLYTLQSTLYTPLSTLSTPHPPPSTLHPQLPPLRP